MGSLDQLFVNLQAAALVAVGKLLPGWVVPWVSILIRIGVIAAIAPAIMMYLTWLERKIIARMQNRFGPNRVGVYGLMQPLADGLKMLIKEDLVPRGADHLLHLLAPVLAVVPAILLFAVMPFGRNMIAADLNVGLLYFFAVSAVGSYAIFMGGWASRSKFSILGAMRSVAQIISYEVPGVISAVTVIMVAGTLSTVGIVEAQAGRWYVFTPWGLVAAVTFFLSGVAEVNRTPFDMPEAESELLGGFHTEYSGMKFALWYMAEFLEAFAIAAFTVTFFLGGWQGPAVPCWIAAVVVAALVATARLLPIWLKGVGLAAPQVGINEAFIVVDAGSGLYKLVNPKILKKEGIQVNDEGCLSVPGVYIKVKRAKKIWVSALDETSKPIKFEAHDLLACALQHEIDHLYGRLIVDYASFFKKMTMGIKKANAAR